MIETQLKTLGRHIAQLRFRHQLKQAELAQAAGVSLRTLQRLEAGEVVKTDVLLKVLARLDRVEALLTALAPAALSPYEQLALAGLTPADLDKPGASAALDRLAADKPGGVFKRRVRDRSTGQGGRRALAGHRKKAATFQWPEDRGS